MDVSLGCIQSCVCVCVRALTFPSVQCVSGLGRLALCLCNATALGLRKLPSTSGHSALFSNSLVQCLLINLVTFHTHL